MWIFAAERADQLANVFRHRRAAALAMANLPTPEQAKALPLPANHRAGFVMQTRDSQPVQREESHAQRTRSAGLNFGRLTER